MRKFFSKLRLSASSFSMYDEKRKTDFETKDILFITEIIDRMSDK